MPLDKLSPYLPEGSVGYVEQILQPYQVKIALTRVKKTKLGTFIPAVKQKLPKITICALSNPYLFLLTLVHEIAHLKTWAENKKRVKPHGKTWKNAFNELMSPLLADGIFPEELRFSLIIHMKNPAASITRDIGLLKSLQVYSNKSTNMVTVEEVAEGSRFIWRSYRIFEKKEKLRKRYRCIDVRTKQVYLFNPLAEVELV
jgi:SprT protein